jgi:ParB-like chromosome segregation protein Spo0J
MKVSQLKLNKKNPRKISPDQMEKLKYSIEKFPKMMSLRPIVYDPDTMEVLGGNQRLLAIRDLGMKEIPDDWVKSADELTEKEKREFIIRDNIQAGDWDFEILEAEFSDFLDSIEEMGLDLPEIMSQDIDEKEQIIVPIKQVHYLVSVPLDKVLDAKSLISELKKIDGVKIEQSQN